MDGDYDCADLETQAQAKAALERDPSDPHYPDGGGDGIPCEDLPSGGSSADVGSPSAPDAVPATAPSTAAGAPPPPSAEDALSMLKGLTVAPSGGMAGYSREEFPHWASEAASHGWAEPDGSCDVGDAALIRDGEGVEIDDDCSVMAGAWLDPYTGRTLTDSSEVDIDHVVPLANAWRSGASSVSWSTANREVYAHDPQVLLSADDGANQIKGDKGPEAWKPPNRDYWCEYARLWIWIKSEWQLTRTSARGRHSDRCLARVRMVEVRAFENSRPLNSAFVSTAGGVMTEEAGAITGELELLTRVTPNGGGIEAMVRYTGAQDLYTVLGSPVLAVSEGPDHVEHRAAHERILETLTTPGRVESGNEILVNLQGG